MQMGSPSHLEKRLQSHGGGSHSGDASGQPIPQATNLRVITVRILEIRGNLIFALRVLNN